MVVQTTDDRTSNMYGSEFLNLYRHIDFSSTLDRVQLHERGLYGSAREMKQMPRTPQGL